MTVLITGVSGQDGSFLAEQLVAQGQRVTGTVSHGEVLPPYIAALQQRRMLDLLACDLSQPAEWRRLLRELKPQLVYHMAAQSSPRVSAEDELSSTMINVGSGEALCDWIRRDSPLSRALLVSSSAIFGNPAESPQREATPKAPVDVYGRQKLAVYEMAADARRLGRFIACAIPFNHESPRRSESFVFQKVCRGAALIKLGLASGLALGDLQSARDWGYAPEYAAAMASMLQTEQPGEFVLATGEAHSVAELVERAFAAVALNPAQYVRSELTLHRDTDFSAAVGDSSLAGEVLGWSARTRFAELVVLMVAAALENVAAAGRVS
jgi:GDPmannose 4,6-dehydratase